MESQVVRHDHIGFGLSVAPKFADMIIVVDTMADVNNYVDDVRVPRAETQNAQRLPRGVCHILANCPDLVRTVPIWRPKPDVPPDDPWANMYSRVFPICPDKQPKNDFKPALRFFIFNYVGIQRKKLFFLFTLLSSRFSFSFRYSCVTGSNP